MEKSEAFIPKMISIPKEHRHKQEYKCLLLKTKSSVKRRLHCIDRFEQIAENDAHHINIHICWFEFQQKLLPYGRPCDGLGRRASNHEKVQWIPKFKKIS